MARPRVPDTSALIEILRQPRLLPALVRSIAIGNTWISSIVLAELYAGTRSPEDTRHLDRIVRAVEPIGRLLNPAPSDWLLAGRLIARRIQLQGALRPRDHLADVLILISAARLGGEVVTANLRHFEAWASLATAAGMNVTVRSTDER